jgi:hypothetical protein
MFDGAAAVLALMLCADAVLLLLHLVNGQLGLPVVRMLSITVDGGYAELFQYLKFFWVCLLLAALCTRTALSRTWPLVLLFAYVLLDDSLQIHERLGTWLAAGWSFELPGALRAKDLGELMVSAAVGLTLLPLLVWAYWGSGRSGRCHLLDVMSLFVMLAGFGIGVDLLHMALLRDDGWGNLVFAMLEDGGEMVAASMLLGYCFWRLQQRETPLVGLVGRLWAKAAVRLRRELPPAH